MGNEEAIKVLTNSIRQRQKQIELIESLINDTDFRVGYISGQTGIIASLERTLGQLRASDTEDTEQQDFGFGPL